MRYRVTVSRSIFMTLLGVVLVAPLNSVAEAPYGDLALGATSYSAMSDVQAEICLDHLFDPSSLNLYLPAGYRLISAATLAKQDSDIASLVKRGRRYATYAVGTLCFLSVEVFVVDGVRAHTPRATASAFWWARARQRGVACSRIRHIY